MSSFREILNQFIELDEKPKALQFEFMHRGVWISRTVYPRVISGETAQLLTASLWYCSARSCRTPGTDCWVTNHSAEVVWTHTLFRSFSLYQLEGIYAQGNIPMSPNDTLPHKQYFLITWIQIKSYLEQADHLKQCGVCAFRSTHCCFTTHWMWEDRTQIYAIFKLQAFNIKCETLVCHQLILIAEEQHYRYVTSFC